MEWGGEQHHAYVLHGIISLGNMLGRKILLLPTSMLLVMVLNQLAVGFEH